MRLSTEVEDTAARAYVHPVLSRENLDVHCKAKAHKILFEGKKAVGVRYKEGLFHKRSIL